jgi:trans-aconitate methyltransferase
MCVCVCVCVRTNRFVPPLADAFPSARIIAVDSSANMLRSGADAIGKTRNDLTSRVTWEEQSIAEFKG